MTYRRNLAPKLKINENNHQLMASISEMANGNNINEIAIVAIM